MPQTWTSTFEGLGTSKRSVVEDRSGRGGKSRESASGESRFPSLTTARGEEGDEREYREPQVGSNNPTELFTLIKDKKWSYAATRANAVPSEAGTWIVEKNVDNTVRWRLLPIHQVCEMQPPEETVKALLDAFPAGAALKDSGGDLPIHLSCRERASVGVVNALLLADPESAKMKDDEGRLPIHLACRQGAGLDIVNNLLVAYHKGAQTPDTYGLLPIHWACAQNAKVSIIEALLRAFPDSVDVKDKWGRTPLSLAQASTNSDKDKIIEALNRDASYWTTALMDEVSELKGKLETTALSEHKIRGKASNLEAKLVEVTAASSAAAQGFRELKEELQRENTELHEQVRELTTKNDRCEKKLKDLTNENRTLKETTRDLTNRLSELTSLLQNMEEQRLEILRVTGHWEDTLQKAAELVLDDDGNSVTSKMSENEKPDSDE